MDTQLETNEPKKQPILSWPKTRLGWWAVGLAVGVLLLPVTTGLINLLINSLSEGAQVGIGLFGMLMVLAGIAGGIIGLIAVVRKHERSILVWLAILQGLFAIFLIVGDILIPH